MSANTVLYQQFIGPTEPSDPGDAKAIVCDRSPCVFNLVSAAAETRTVPDPTRAGALMTLYHLTDGGDITITFATAYDEIGSTVLVLSDPGQFAIFQSVRTGPTTFQWRMISNSQAATAGIPVNAVAAGYKLARGVATITGTGTVVTGLATVVAIVATMQADASLTNGISVTATIGDQAGTPAAGSVILKVWKPTASGDVTPIAGAAAVAVNWVAIGT